MCDWRPGLGLRVSVVRIGRLCADGAAAAAAGARWWATEAEAVTAVLHCLEGHQLATAAATKGLSAASIAIAGVPEALGGAIEVTHVAHEADTAPGRAIPLPPPWPVPPAVSQ